MIYLDYAASTPLHPNIRKNLPNYFGESGNAQSHQMKHLHQIIERSKQHIASYLSANPARIFFTSGATESISTAIVGASEFYRKSGNHIISFESEHPSVLRALDALRKKGFDISILPILSNGHIDYQQLTRSIRPDTILISVNHVCNETGIIHNLTPLIDLKKKHGFMIHLDACQTIGKTSLNLQNLPIDFVSLSAHKTYGPQGIGALYIAEGRHISPIIHGSHPVRSGTLSHALIEMMGDAYLLAAQEIVLNTKHICQIRQKFLKELQAVNFKHSNEKQEQLQVPHILNLYFPEASSSIVDLIRQEIYCQISSACHKGGLSHVLKARGFSTACIKRSIRFSFGMMTTDLEAVTAAQFVIKAITSA